MLNFSTYKLVGEALEHLIAHFAEIQFLHSIHGFFGKPQYFFLSHLVHAETHVYVLDSLYLGSLLLIRVHRHCHSLVHCGPVQFGRLDREPAFLLVYDVAADRLAKHLLIAKGIQPVVSDLECQTERITVSVEISGIFIISACDKGTHLGRAGDQHRSFQPDHLHILVHGHLVQSLEIHVILLTFTHLRSRIAEELQHLADDGLRSMGNSFVTVNAHHVAGQDRPVLAPFRPYCRIAASERRLVHDVIMDQCKCMEHLKSGCRLEYLIIELILEKRVRNKTKPWAQALSATVNHVSERVIKPCRFL